MGYYIGIDGGGTKTHGLLSLGDRLLAETTVGPTNYHSIGLSEMQCNIKLLLEKLLTNANISINDLECICIGAAGVDCDADREVVEKSFRDIGYKGKLKVYNDSVIALVGANGGYEGGLIISGTGSIAIGISSEGNISRVGGWGHLYDDLGSGYTIGKCAISEVFKTFDNRGDNTILTKELLKHFEVKTVPDLIPIVYDKNLDKSTIAELAEIVLRNYFDPVCDKIICENTDDLVCMVKALSKNIHEDNFKLSVSGSLLIKSQYYYNYFKDRLKKELPSVNIKMPDMEAVHGALLIARSY